MICDTAPRFGRVLGTGPEFWMNLQSRYEIETARAALDMTSANCARFIPTRSSPERTRERDHFVD